MTKRVLIVDDDVRVLRYLRQGLLALGDEFEIIAAESPEEALEIVNNTKPELVISDLRMPRMDGLQLMQQIKQIHEPTRLVLMTAYGTNEAKETAQKLGIYRFITKPFRHENLVNIARSALSDNEQIAIGTDGILVFPDKSLTEINTVLDRLRTEIRPEMAIMADMSGHVITHVGTTMGMDLNALVALVAGSFASARELDRIVDVSQGGLTVDVPDDEPIYVTYQEGLHHDCYSANVGKDLFFTAVFKRRGANKVGMVWLYMRRTFRELQKVVMTNSSDLPDDLVNVDQETVTQYFKDL